MIRCTIFAPTVLVACFASTSLRAEDSIVKGHVVDASGVHVPNADLSLFWRANGIPYRADGTEYSLDDRAEASEFWGNIGDMQPFRPGTTTDADGKFTLDTAEKRQFIVMDEARRNGAVFRFGARTICSDVEIKLGPLTTVKASVHIEGSDSKPIWSHVYVYLEQDPSYPLAKTRLVSCGSETQAFEFSLPKGTYRLEVTAVSGKPPENSDLRVFPDRELVIHGDGGAIDLGVLKLQDDLPGQQDLERGSKEAKRWREYTQHYGEPCPRWHAVDARGVDADANIEELRGKWVLLEFWGLGCSGCLSRHLPEMMDFYNRHAAQRDQFEVIGVCIDFRGELKSIQELDTALQPIVEHVWGGKEIPFPIVLDTTFKTWERFGIPGLGTTVLVDPKGNLREGGIETIQRVLKNGKPSDEPKSR